MTKSIVLVGPASAQWLGDSLAPEDRLRAQHLYGLGGTALTNLTKAFLAAGKHVELVTLAPELEHGESVILEGPRLRILIGPYRPRARHHGPDAFREERRHVRRLLFSTSGSVVNAHWTYEFALGATRLPSRVTVVTAHDAPFTVLRHLRPRTYRALRAGMAIAVRLQSPVLTAVSPYLAATWRKQMFYRGHISVVPNVVPVAVTTREHANELSTPTILEVADAGRLKNVKSLLEAMPTVIAAYPGARLRLAGHGLTPQSPLARLAGRLGVADNVDFLGRVGPAELGLLYRKADLFVHASIEEACPMSVAEAMSYQLPVIGGRRAGGIPWLLDQGRAGLLVDVKRPDAIASGVLGLLEDDHLRRQMGLVARERVRAHFSPQTVSEGYLEAYARAEGKS